MESPIYSEISESSADIHAVIFSRKNSILFEYYRKPEYSYNLHTVYSITKSIVALSMWLVIRKHGLAILHEPILKYCPEFDKIPKDSNWQKMTLHHLLSQTSGLNWKEMGAKWGSGNPLWEMEHHHDWLAYVLEIPFQNSPGDHFGYCSGASHLIPFLMGKILKVDISEYLHEEILFPVGIDHLLWEADPQGNLIGGKGLHLRPRDLLKFGELILNQGKIGDSEIISPEWINTCFTKHSRGIPFYGEYGYQWWLQPNAIVCATGFGGQNLIVDQRNELVGVFLGNLGKRDIGLPLKWYHKLRNQCLHA